MIRTRRHYRVSHLRTPLTFALLSFLTAFLCVIAVPAIAHSAAGGAIVQPAAAASDSPQQTAENWEQQARQLYEVGRFSEAVAVLQKALQSYRAQGDILGQAIVLSNLSLSHQQLGVWDTASQEIQEALSLLQTGGNLSGRTGVQAQALDVQGSLQLAQGKASQALESWQQAATRYLRAGDLTRAAQSQINQAQALQTMGLYRRAIATLEQLEASLKTQPSSLTKAATLRSLGDALRVIGNLERAEQVLQQSLEMAKQGRSPEAIASIHLSLGNLAFAQAKVNKIRGWVKPTQEKLKAALSFYQRAAESPSSLTRAQAALNYLDLLTEPSASLPSKINRESEIKALYAQVQQLLPSLPPGRATIALQVSLGQTLLKVGCQRLSTNCPAEASNREAAQLFAKAVQQARSLNDQRALSESLGNLGGVYEKNQQWSEAQTLTEQALVLAQAIDASEIAYRWQWQLGRILKARGNSSPAIAAYSEAFKTLQSLRRDLVATNLDVQFSFRESVEPVYRQFVDLLLQPQDTAEPSQANLRQARQVLESLQVAELENFLQAACQDNSLQIDRVIDRGDPTAAVIYPIILDDRLEVILKLPGEADLYRYPPTRLPRQQIVETLSNLQINLQDESAFSAVQEDGKTIYSWLIQPVQDRLEAKGIKTLIFVLDGPLRTIPMAGLYDGEHYLVEKYATSLVLGLEVRDPQPLHRQTLKVLAASLTDPPKGFEKTFATLPNVDPELDRIRQTQIPATLIRDRAFTQAAFKQALNSSSFQVVHLATHGQFGASRESTYLLAADGAIYVDNLSEFFRTRGQARADAIELLILSACKTATGNDRAVLGIAGTTVRSGARSAIAGLWSLSDASSVRFTQEFYKHLGQSGVTRAEALRRAQVALLKAEDMDYSHPRFWAPYVLVGSWL